MRNKYLLALSLVFFFQAQGAPKVKKVKNKPKKSRAVSFDEILVQGKHHFSDEAVVTVEDDKVLDALLEVRKDFKDRVKQSAQRN